MIFWWLPFSHRLSDVAHNGNQRQQFVVFANVTYENQLSMNLINPYFRYPFISAQYFVQIPSLQQWGSSVFEICKSITTNHHSSRRSVASTVSNRITFNRRVRSIDSFDNRQQDHQVTVSPSDDVSERFSASSIEMHAHLSDVNNFMGSTKRGPRGPKWICCCIIVDVQCGSLLS
jgi:hypothetical protein